jgi:hypothetical protein
VNVSWPTVPKSRPRTIIASALTVEPRVSVVDAMRPSTTNEKKSAEPNSSAKLASTGANSTTTSVPTVPATNEPIAAAARAAPALPSRAMTWPSIAVTADEVSPGMLMRIAVVEPPYCAP